MRLCDAGRKTEDDTLSDLKSIEPRKDALIDDPGRRCGSLLMVAFFDLPAPSFA
jgi:hypothetical protein